ncbi:hypothetical protein LIER_25791 [Lithospermum erythrorhizon]|uniref:Uncharacterized protein n=1 Tax=Lithospermum erythrorhizon TaxID=34254 RepID=A0AAV3RBZ5_LITER
MREERDSALSKKDKAVGKYNSALADLEGTKTSLNEHVLEKEALALRLSEAEKSVVAAVETFKNSDDYQELLKDNTATLIRGFCHDVSSDFPGIASNFKRYVTNLGEKFVTELFDDLPEEQDEGDEEDEDDVGSDQEQNEGGD